MRRCFWLLFGLACADPEPSPDAGVTGPDAAPIDLGHFSDASVQDTGPDLGFADSGEQPDAQNADAQPMDIGSTDSGPQICPPGAVRGLTFGRIGVPFVSLPGAKESVQVERVESTTNFVHGYVASFSDTGFEWLAQVVQSTEFDNLTIERAVRDAAGAVYLAVESQVRGGALRFYHADNTLGAEFTTGGASGRDLLGRDRQSNFFIAKYTPVGQLEWVHRFGPREGGGERAGAVRSLSLAADRVRVGIWLESGPGRIQFGPAEPSEFNLSLNNQSGVVAEFLTTTGAYVGGSARWVGTGDHDSLLDGYGGGPGVWALGGRLTVPARTTATHQVGAGAGMPISVTSTLGSAFVAGMSVEGTPRWVRKAILAERNRPPRVRALTTAASGEVFAAGDFNGQDPGGTYFFETNGPLQPIAADQPDLWVVGYSADGDLDWWLRIDILGNFAPQVRRLVVDPTRDRLEVLTGAAQGMVIGPGTATETRQQTMATVGWISLRASTGEVIAFKELDPAGFYTVPLLGFSANAAYLPVSATLYQAAPGVWVAPSGGDRATILVRHDFDHNFVDCVTVSNLISEWWFDP